MHGGAYRSRWSSHVNIKFIQGAPGDRGREMRMHTYAPDNVPEPIAWGTYMSMPDTHFYICVCRDMVDDLPGVSKLGALVSKLHLDSMGKSPGGKYGFHATMHLANVPNDNTWCDTWEEWFTNAMRRMIQAEEKSHGPDDGLKELTNALFAKVIPRLLRPLNRGVRNTTLPHTFRPVARQCQARRRDRPTS